MYTQEEIRHKSSPGFYFYFFSNDRGAIDNIYTAVTGMGLMWPPGW